MSLRPAARLLPLLALLAACATSDAADPPADADAAALPPIPFCRDEMTAYVELTRVARAHGDGWVVFMPAIDALQAEIIDCVEDHTARFHQLRLDRAPAPTAPAPRSAP
jgi:hypothetical protein